MEEENHFDQNKSTLTNYQTYTPKRKSKKTFNKKKQILSRLRGL